MVAMLSSGLFTLRAGGAGLGIRDSGFGNRLAQDRSEHFLHRRLAIAAGQCHKRYVEFASPVRCQRAQREPGVFCDEQGKPVRSPVPGPRSLNERARRPFFRGQREEIVAVEALAFEGDEQSARRQRPGIGADRVERPVFALELGRDRARGFGEAHEAHRCASASSATCASENACRTPRISW
jgi:hypothetical protein